MIRVRESRAAAETWSLEEELQSKNAFGDLIADPDGIGGRARLEQVVTEAVDAVFAALEASEDETLRSMMAAAGLSDMNGVVLRKANLRGEDLSGISFVGTDFTSADLRNCDFSGCDLRGADFESAKLAGARFPEARVDPQVVATAEAARVRAEEWTKFGILGLFAGTVWGVRALWEGRSETEAVDNVTASGDQAAEVTNAVALEAPPVEAATYRVSS